MRALCGAGSDKDLREKEGGGGGLARHTALPYDLQEPLVLKIHFGICMRATGP